MQQTREKEKWRVRAKREMVTVEMEMGGYRKNEKGLKKVKKREKREAVEERGERKNRGRGKYRWMK